MATKRYGFLSPGSAAWGLGENGFRERVMQTPLFLIPSEIRLAENVLASPGAENGTIRTYDMTIMLVLMEPKASADPRRKGRCILCAGACLRTALATRTGE